MKKKKSINWTKKNPSFFLVNNLNRFFYEIIDFFYECSLFFTMHSIMAKCDSIKDGSMGRRDS